MTDIYTSFTQNFPNIQEIDYVFIDMSGKIKGKRSPISSLKKIHTHGINIPQTVYLIDVTGTQTEAGGYGFDDGDPDAIAYPLIETLGCTPSKCTTDRAQLLMHINHSYAKTGHIDCFFEPRLILKQQIDKLKSLGLIPCVAYELEFNLLKPQNGENGVPIPIMHSNPANIYFNGVYDLSSLDLIERFIQDVNKYAKSQNLDIDSAVTEYAPGQYEINLNHQDDCLKAADNAALLRNLINKTAYCHDMVATFMPKPFKEFSGNGMHLHVSLKNTKGENVFAAGENLTENTYMRHVLGGMQNLMADSMAFFSPHANAFRRYAKNMFVPLNTLWAENNRSAALRIPISTVANRRIEHRCASADANPYLVGAAILAAIYHGITHEIEPTPVSKGNLSCNRNPQIPTSIYSALERLQNSTHSKVAYGEDFINTYVAHKTAENEHFLSYITPLEYSFFL